MTPTSGTLLPRMGLGMAALGRPGYINLDRSSDFGNSDTIERTVAAMQTRADVVLDQLFASAKISSSQPWIDCARSYGKSEEFVGTYLRSRKVDPSSVYVSSKWGYTYVADWKVSLETRDAKHEVKDHSTANFLKQVEETAENLGEYVDLYQIHSATMDSGILTDTTAHEALAKCRQERGWKLGMSVSGPNQDEIIRTALKIKDPLSVRGDCLLFDSVQCTFNLLEQRPAAALQEARDAGLDIIIKEGMANGRVFRHGGIQKLAQEHCENHIDQLALAFILGQPFRPRVLSGAVTSEQLESNLLASDLCDRLFLGEGRDPELLRACFAIPGESNDEYWQERAELEWN